MMRPVELDGVGFLVVSQRTVLALRKSDHSLEVDRTAKRVPLGRVVTTRIEVGDGHHVRPGRIVFFVEVEVSRHVPHVALLCARECQHLRDVRLRTHQAVQTREGVVDLVLNFAKFPLHLRVDILLELILRDVLDLVCFHQHPVKRGRLNTAGVLYVFDFFCHNNFD